MARMAETAGRTVTAERAGASFKDKTKHQPKYRLKHQFKHQLKQLNIQPAPCRTGAGAMLSILASAPFRV
jgi:hypothetical protein